MNSRRNRLCASILVAGVAGSAGRLDVAAAGNSSPAATVGASPAMREAEAPARFRPVAWQPVDQAAISVQLDRAAWQAMSDSTSAAVVEEFPLDAETHVTLELSRFTITRPDVQFVVGRRGGPDRPLPFDPAEIQLFRGRVQGYPDSRALLVLSDRLRSGFVQLAEDERPFRLSGGRTASDETTWEVRVFPTRGSSAGPPAPLCGLDDVEQPLAGDGKAGWTQVTNRSVDAAQSGGAFAREMHLIDLAVETDFELFDLFGDANDAATYVVALLAEVNEIYRREVNARFMLTFLRLWDLPDDLFNEPDPLVPFRNYWNANMGAVPRDVAHFMSGRRDLPYGGVAYLSALCQSFGYSVTGYLVGSFPDPARPSYLHYDVDVVAHELGHNCGTLHTHDYGIDNCQNFNAPPRRGTIMSYCSQTYSGANANTDLRFHRTVQGIMRNFISTASCVMDDCNENGLPDDEDVNPVSGTSEDVNGNGIPDECEDCNANGVLDSMDISNGTSTDLNGNGIPDECEPDCNGNNRPDTLDISQGLSTDAYGNNVPDECETDCNNNGTSDYTELQATMSLDIDRNTLLDACEDCDNDGTPDLVALSGSHNVWVASIQDGALREFHATSGVLVRAGSPGQVNQPQDLIVTPDGRVLVSSGADDRVLEFASDGTFLGNLVATGAGGLDFPTGLAMGSDGRLYVASQNTNSVLRFDGATGAFVNAFVASGSGGLVSPFGLAFHPGGNLLVTSADNRVLEFDGTTGSPLGDFVTAADNGGLSAPRGLVFKPDGNLLVASFNTNQLLEFDGTTGAFLRQFNNGGTAVALTLDGPWTIRIGPDGQVYANRFFETTPEGQAGSFLHLNATRIYVFDPRNGNFLRSFVTGNDTVLSRSTGFDFLPGWSLDCNRNTLPDSCDIASGASLDLDADGVPDECQVDCNGNTVFDRLEVIPYGSLLDCNGNFSPDSCDLAGGVSADCNANGVPDECEWQADCDFNRVPDACEFAADPSLDCNTNGVLDRCDLLVGASPDLNANGIPDECDRNVPTRPDFPHNVPKNRYLSFEPANADATAFRVEITAGPDAPLVLGYVAAPFDPGCENEDGTPKVPAAPCVGEAVARISSQPVIRTWTEPLVHVADCAVVPAASYDLRATAAGVLFTAPLSIATVAEPTPRLWGDVVGNKVGTTWQAPQGVVNVDDVQAALENFRTAPSAPHTTWIDLDGQRPNYIINVTDVQLILHGFSGRAYPFASPGQCP